jgi:hypothetical protein
VRGSRREHGENTQQSRIQGGDIDGHSLYTDTDDAWGAATAGFGQGGTAITAALTFNDDLIVDVDSEGQLPYLTDVIMHEFDVCATGAGLNAHWTLRPNTWPSTRTLAGYCDVFTSQYAQVGADVDVGFPMTDFVRGRFNIPLAANTSWISSDSKIYATAANSDILMCLVYSYGQRYPYKGGHLQYVSAVAGGAATADTWTQAWSQNLQGVGYGLDPTKTYVLRGVGGGNDVVDEVCMGFMGSKQTGFHQMVGFGGGNTPHQHMTYYMHDGIPVNGLDGITANMLLGATGTPWVTLCFEEYGGSTVGTGRFGAPTRPSTGPGAPSGRNVQVAARGPTGGAMRGRTRARRNLPVGTFNVLG